MAEVPISQKAFLTLEEAAAYFGIGINKLREISDSDSCDFILWVGRKRLIKRREMYALSDFLIMAFVMVSEAVT